MAPIGKDTQEDTISTFDQDGNVLVLPRSEFVRHCVAEARNARGNPAYLTQLGRELISKGYPRDAIQIYEWSSKALPAAPEPKIGLGVCYYLIGKYRKARRLLSACAAEHPDSAPAFFQLHRVYKALNEPGKSAEALEKSMALDPNNHVVLHAYLKHQADLGLVDTAIKKMLAVAEADTWGPYYVLGNHYFDTHEKKKAIECFVSAIDRDIDDREVLTEITAVLGELNRCDLIVKHLEPIASRRILPFGPLWNLARAYYEIGEFENARFLAEGLLKATTDANRSSSLQRFLMKIETKIERMADSSA